MWCPSRGWSGRRHRSIGWWTRSGWPGCRRSRGSGQLGSAGGEVPFARERAERAGLVQVAAERAGLQDLAPH